MTAATDLSIIKKVWEGKIAVTFTLSPDEAVTEPVEPFYMVIPRMNYLPFIVDTVKAHFKPAHPSIQTPGDTNARLWFSYDGVPLKWHFPVGLLFDLLGPSVSGSLPWHIFVHFDNYPENELLHSTGSDALESYYMSTLKEADCIRHGSVKNVSSLQKLEQKQLWNGLKNGDFEKFASIHEKLLRNDEDTKLRSIPFRIHRPSQPVLQDIFAPYDTEGNPRSFGDLLSTVLSDKFPSGDTKAWADEGSYGQWRVLVQGFTPPAETPALWLSDCCSYPDNFLNIVVRPA
eukprot:Colp12_sorted_trinity150504_noHs@32804